LRKGVWQNLTAPLGSGAVLVIKAQAGCIYDLQGQPARKACIPARLNYFYSLWSEKQI
jgi:hypothetical protein